MVKEPLFTGKAIEPLMEEAKYNVTPMSEMVKTLITANNTQANFNFPNKSISYPTTKSLAELTAKINNAIPQALSTFNALTSKLFIKALQNFMENNNRNSDITDLIVFIPLREFALECGYLTDELLTDEKTKEKLKNFTKEIRNSMNYLRGYDFTFKEKVNGKWDGVTNVSMIGSRSVSISKNYIKLVIDAEFGEYIKKLNFILLNENFFKIPNRQQNAIILALILNLHFSIVQNQIKGTAGVLRVDTILKYLNLNETKSNKWNGWQNRIKEPFEHALDILTQYGVIDATWDYKHAKNEPLNDEEIQNLKNLTEWKKWYLHFSMKNFPDQTKTIESHKKRVAQNKKRAQAKKSKEKAT